MAGKKNADGGSSAQPTPSERFARLERRLLFNRRPDTNGRLIMKVLLSVFGVLGLAVVFGLFEPASASTQPVTSDDVQMVSEQMSSQAGPTGYGKNARKKRRTRPRRGGRD